MKEFACPANIGDGLFTDDAVEIKITFPDESYAEIKLYALTPAKIIQYRKEGLKFDNYKNDEEALDNSVKMVNKLAKSGMYYPKDREPIALSADNNHRLVNHIALLNTIVRAARSLAEEQVVEDLKNSVS